MDKLIESDEVETDTVPVREVSISNRPSLLRMILFFLLAVVIVILFVLLARWIYHSVQDSGKNPTTTSSGQTTLSPNVSKEQSTQSQQNTQSSGNVNAPTSPNNPTTGSSGTKTNNTLPNNGPGDVAAVFVGASLAAGGLHYLIKVRRFSKA
ncbi:MAG TPA: hypothetical protein VLF88_02165 [Candidatus Babeliales bacterium]|nr:hypothetical protein [Candidatus Babeliales bacterium]